MTEKRDVQQDSTQQADDRAVDRSSSTASGDRVHGEGNYEATRDYNRDTKSFIDAGKVDEAARKAEPENSREAKEMEKAEAEGAARSKS